MKTVLIVGCEGQDGRLLIESLAGNAHYYGIDRQRSRTNIPGLAEEPTSIADAQSVRRLIERVQPDEVYYLAAFHHSSEEKRPDETELFDQSYRINVLGLVGFLDAIRRGCPSARLFYASSSHIFGEAVDGGLLNESTPFAPDSVYGMSKLSGLLACRYYREHYGVFASVGILFNHESGLRPPQFLSKRIVSGALAIKRGQADELVLGDLSAAADWGYAPDYVRAMRAILAHDRPDDFVVATGVKHTVKDFVVEAFRGLGMEKWEDRIREDRSRIVGRSLTRVGDPEKLIGRTGWQPSVDFRGMVEALLGYEEGRANG